MSEKLHDYVIVLEDFPKLSKTLDIPSLDTKNVYRAITVENHKRAFSELELKLKGNKIAFENIMNCLDYDGNPTYIHTKHRIGGAFSGNFLKFLGIIKNIENSDDYTWNDFNRTSDEIAMYYLIALKKVNQFQKTRKKISTPIDALGSMQSEINFPDFNENIEKSIDVTMKSENHETIKEHNNDLVSVNEMKEMLLLALGNQPKSEVNLTNANLIADAANNLASAINDLTEVLKDFVVFARTRK